MFQATRRRLALWYTAITALLLLLFASGVYLYVHSTLIERIDDTLNHVAEVVERSLVIEPADPDANLFRINVEASFRDNAGTVEDDHIDLEWFSPTGELLWSTLWEPLNIPIHANRAGKTVQVVKGGEGSELENKTQNSYLLRQVTERVQLGRQVLGYLRVSHPWFEVTKPSQQLVVDLCLGTGLMLVSVAASGWFLSGKAMEPVRESYQRLKQFTADASHELRSPITLIQTNVQVALSEPDLVEAQLPTSLQYRQHLKVVERLTQRLGRLVDDLLFLARQDSGIVQPRFSPCPLDALLIEVIEEQHLAAIDKGIALSLDLVDAPDATNPEDIENWFTVEGDWNQLVRLFTNLIGNAVQYTPPNGKVRVRLERTAISGSGTKVWYGRIPSPPTSPAFLRSPLTSGLQIQVSDTGIGIPESALPRLFDRFYRIDPARTHTTTAPTVEKTTGSGLGLAIAAAIVDNHQGQIQVESPPGQGTTFTVTLPLHIEG